MREDVFDELFRLDRPCLGARCRSLELQPDDGAQTLALAEEALDAALEHELMHRNEHRSMPPGGVEQCGRGSGIRGGRLLDDHMRSRGESGPDDLDVGLRRRADVDDVDSIVQLRNGRLHACAVRQRPGTREIGIDDGCDRSSRGGDGGGVEPTHQTGAGDHGAERHHRGRGHRTTLWGSCRAAAAS